MLLFIFVPNKAMKQKYKTVAHNLNNSCQRKFGKPYDAKMKLIRLASLHELSF